MRSKITIDTASNFKPCIRVQEPQSHHMIDSDTEDVRDKLVKGFRELLHHTSSTVEVIYEGGENHYILYPVEDELSYMKVLVHKWMHDTEARVKLKAMAHKILIDLGEGVVDAVSERIVFEKFHTMCLESLSPENFEALEKINDELTNNRPALRITSLKQDSLDLLEKYVKEGTMIVDKV